MNILVCGGAGYIGSHMTRRLLSENHTVTVFDDCSTGHAEAVHEATLVKGDLLDPAALAQIFATRSFDAVMHFSARSLVGESVGNPALYYRNNVLGTMNLLDAMRDHGVSRFIFSSTAAIFGNPISELIDEEHPKLPINPYGKSKLMVENILADYASAYGLRSVSLRYFNAAGADASGEIGEAHEPETHLIPNVLRAALGKGEDLKIFGDDYPTPDGTCVRDYIHVEDLCDAHLRALEHIDKASGALCFNLGNGTGFSVRQVLEAAEKISNRRIPYSVQARRPGDPPRLVADSQRARSILGWQARYTSIEGILASAWRWHQSPAF